MVTEQVPFCTFLFNLVAVTILKSFALCRTVSVAGVEGGYLAAEEA